MQMKRKGFTLIELLVVTAVLALLLSILTPALRKARAYGRALVSLSNTRQWGMGAMMFAAENNNFLPWEGNKDENLGDNFFNPKWWANAVPPMLGQEPYRSISEQAVQSGGTVPLPPCESSIFIDPAARFPEGFTRSAVRFYDSIANYEYQLFFCYVWNSELNNGPTASVLDDIEEVNLTRIRQPGQTVLMLEMRTTNDELDKSDYNYYRTRSLLGRHRGDWKRFARRHLKGGHIVFCDGHAERVDYERATTNRQGSRNPDYPGGNWNQTDLIWNAFGPSLK